MLYFVDVFYNIKCLKNTYFVCSILLNMKQMLVFIFINFFFLVLSFDPPGTNLGFVPAFCQHILSVYLCCCLFMMVAYSILVKVKYAKISSKTYQDLKTSLSLYFYFLSLNCDLHFYMILNVCYIFWQKAWPMCV